MEATGKGKQGPMGSRKIPTGAFSDWLQRTRQARKSNAGADVPCGECRGCCTSSYFIHIRPDETGTLSRIPKNLLFPAPGLPKGHKLMGYDEKGHCPMFIDNGCSIYEHRPQTCRDYDCRIFPATGLDLGEEKPAISKQAERWKFTFPETRDKAEFAAVHAAAEFLDAHASKFPSGFVPGNATQRAILALKAYRVFLDPPGKSGNERGKRSEAALIKAVLDAFEKFESG
jgi:Fe-S-cluster containining protein